MKLEIFGSHKEPCTAGGPMMSHRDLWEALGGKDTLAYPCSQVLPTHSLSDPELRDLRVLRGSIFFPCNPCVPPTVGPVPNKFFSLWSLW